MKISKSTLAKINRAIRRGWVPGKSLSAAARGKERANHRPGYNSPANQFNDDRRGDHE
jgi:hypothetical protein